MEELTLTTPAVLFSAISLILLAYTNRFLAYASLVRTLYDRFQQKNEKSLAQQIQHMKLRLRLIQAMQILGIGSLLLCVLCMFLIYIKWHAAAEGIFGIALCLLIFSLMLSIREIHISVKALDLQLGDMGK